MQAAEIGEVPDLSSHPEFSDFVTGPEISPSRLSSKHQRKPTDPCNTPQDQLQHSSATSSNYLLLRMSCNWLSRLAQSSLQSEAFNKRCRCLGCSQGSRFVLIMPSRRRASGHCQGGVHLKVLMVLQCFPCLQMSEAQVRCVLRVLSVTMIIMRLVSFD